MHNYDEGMVVYTVSGVLNHLIFFKKIITLDEINRRTATFTYGDLESPNTPRPLGVEVCPVDLTTGRKSSVKCKQLASEMCCLVRYLGLMLGDIIDRED